MYAKVGKVQAGRARNWEAHVAGNENHAFQHMKVPTHAQDCDEMVNIELSLTGRGLDGQNKRGAGW
jgi:uncharacterized protein YbjQ (UPF0145 family)